MIACVQAQNGKREQKNQAEKKNYKYNEAEFELSQFATKPNFCLVSGEFGTQIYVQWGIFQTVEQSHLTRLIDEISMNYIHFNKLKDHRKDDLL